MREYPADGERPSDLYESFCSSLDEAREIVKERLGDLAGWRKWGGFDDESSPILSLEAYHASRSEGCGKGYPQAHRPDREARDGELTRAGFLSFRRSSRTEPSASDGSRSLSGEELAAGRRRARPLS